MENNFNPRIKQDQFGPRSIEEIKNDMQKARQRPSSIQPKIEKQVVNIQPKQSSDIKKRIDNMNNLRNRSWR